MQTISFKEKQKYADIWSLPDYANNSPGEALVDFFISIANPIRGSSIIDVGAGNGAGSRALADRGFHVTALDLTDAAWIQDSRIRLQTGCVWNGITHANVFDFAYCCDMLEHIPTQFVALTVKEILKVATNVFFSISFMPDNFGNYIQEDLHLTVKPFAWWRDTFRELGVLEDARDLLGEGVFYVRHR